MTSSQTKPVVVATVALALLAPLAGCAYGPPDSAAQVQAVVDASIDTIPTNRQIAERKREQARLRAERARKAEERKVQRTLREARRRQVAAAQRFRERETGGEGGEGGGNGGGD